MKKLVSLFVLLICAFVLNAQNFSLEGDYPFDVNSGSPIEDIPVIVHSYSNGEM